LKAVSGLFLVPLFIILAACATATDYTLLSKSFYEQQDYDDAIHNARLAIEMDPDYNYSWLWLGMSQLKKNEYREAINSLDKADQLSTDAGLQKSINYHIGYAYSQINDCDNAIARYNQVLASGPDWMTYLHRGFCYINKSMFDEALSDGHHAIRQIETDNDKLKTQAHRVIAFSNLGLGNTELAKNIITQLQQNFPSYDAWNDLLVIADVTEDKNNMATLLKNRGWLDLKLANNFDNVANGAKVDSASSDNQDMEKKLQTGDIIISLNNNHINSANDLNNIIKLQKPGKPAQIKVLRSKPVPQQGETPESDFEELELEVTVKSTPANVARDVLKDHPYYSVINEKKNYYKPAREAVESNDYSKAFDLYMASAGKHWMDSEILGEVIETYWKTEKQLPIPEQASKDAFFAEKMKYKIRDTNDLDETINMYRNIIQSTPWWADMHYTLAALYEKRQDYRLAANSLELYLISAVEEDVEVITGESRYDIIKKKIYDLEYKDANSK
jgi:hypothetical protein